MSKKLTRSVNDKMIAGVAAGLAEYFQLDVTWVRIAFTLAAFFGGGGIWIYIILWIAVPKSNILFKYEQETPPIKDKQPSSVSGNFLAGLALIVLGSYFLLDEFDLVPEWFGIGKLWPLIFVAIGLSILFKGAKEENQKKEFDTSDFKKTNPNKVDEEIKIKEEETRNPNSDTL